MTLDPDLAAALCAAQAELTNPTKDSKADAGNYGYTYAGLDAVLAHVRPVLAKHGLAVRQDVTLDGGIVVTTYLVHSSGAELPFGPLAGPAGNTYQMLGSGITYLRRYALLAALGIAAEDDDGHAAAKTDPKAEPARGTATVDVKGKRGPAARDWAATPATDDQRKLIGRLVREAGYESSQAFLASELCRRILGGEPSAPLVKGHASSLIDGLQEYLASVEDVPPADPDPEVDPDVAGEDYEAGR